MGFYTSLLIIGWISMEAAKAQLHMFLTSALDRTTFPPEGEKPDITIYEFIFLSNTTMYQLTHISLCIIEFISRHDKQKKSTLHFNFI
jgi:hypothetical protein